MSNDDRPKKSWRELDRNRDRGSGGTPRRDRESWDRDRVSKSAAYGKYKSQLDKLFKPGGGMELPEHLKAKLGPVSEETSKQREVKKALHEKKDERSLREYIDQGLDLPDDPRLLMSFLDTDDEELLVPVLQTLLDIVEGGKRPNRMLLIQRLDSLVLRLGEGDAVELAQTIRAALD